MDRGIESGCQGAELSFSRCCRELGVVSPDDRYVKVEVGTREGGVTAAGRRETMTLAPYVPVTYVGVLRRNGRSCHVIIPQASRD